MLSIRELLKGGAVDQYRYWILLNVKRFANGFQLFGLGLNDAGNEIHSTDTTGLANW